MIFRTPYTTDKFVFENSVGKQPNTPDFRMEVRNNFMKRTLLIVLFRFDINSKIVYVFKEKRDGFSCFVLFESKTTGTLGKRPTYSG